MMLGTKPGTSFRRFTQPIRCCLPTLDMMSSAGGAALAVLSLHNDQSHVITSESSIDSENCRADKEITKTEYWQEERTQHAKGRARILNNRNVQAKMLHTQMSNFNRVCGLACNTTPHLDCSRKHHWTHGNMPTSESCNILRMSGLL